MASSNSIKVVGTLYPNSKLWPVVESSDIKGGLHTVQVYDDLAKISRYRREEGMLCYVILLKEYYQFKGNKWVLFETGGSSSVSKGLLIVTADELDPSSEYYNPDLYDKSKISDGDLIFVQSVTGEETFKLGFYLAFYYTDDEGNEKIDYNNGERAGSPYGLNNIVTQNQIIDKIDKTKITDSSGNYDEELVEEYSKTVPNMKAVIDYVDEHGSIMCADALNYYEVQYHKMFNFTWTLTVLISASTTSINPNNVDSVNVVLTATFGASNGYIHYPDPSNGKIVDNMVNLTITEIKDVDSSWTVSDTNPFVYTKTVTISKDGDAGYNYKTNPLFSISGNVSVKKWSAEKQLELDTLETKNANKSITIGITRSNYWFNDVPDNTMTKDYFVANYKTASLFESGENQSFLTVLDKNLFFCSQKNIDIKQSGNDLGSVVGSIDTPMGNYKVYKTTHAGNDSIWGKVTVTLS